MKTAKIYNHRPFPTSLSKSISQLFSKSAQIYITEAQTHSPLRSLTAAPGDVAVHAASFTRSADCTISQFIMQSVTSEH